MSIRHGYCSASQNSLELYHKTPPVAVIRWGHRWIASSSLGRIEQTPWCGQLVGVSWCGALGPQIGGGCSTRSPSQERSHPPHSSWSVLDLLECHCPQWIVGWQPRLSWRAGWLLTLGTAAVVWSWRRFQCRRHAGFCLWSFPAWTRWNVNRHVVLCPSPHQLGCRALPLGPTASHPSYQVTVPQSKGDPKILKRGPNLEQKGDPNDVKGDPKFVFFRIVHKEWIC